MLHSFLRTSLALAFFGLLLVPGTTWAQDKQRPHKVSDEVGLFSADAKQDANAVIADIKKKHKKDLVIETRESVPNDADPGKWVKKHADETGIDGVYILITLKPKKHFEVYVGNKTREKYFVTENRDHVMKILKEKLGKKPDEALADVAHYTQESMNKNDPAVVAPPVGQPKPKPAPRVEPAPAPAPDPVGHRDEPQTNWLAMILPWVCLIVGVGLVIWVIFAIIRAVTGMGGGGGYGYGGGGMMGGGGGFFTGMLGGLFGAMAGMWIYNNMFGGHASYGSNGQVDWGGGSSGAGSAPYEADTGGTTAGGDWGDDDAGGGADGGGGKGDDGGGDWDKGGDDDAGGGGGGDAGGGDWGGGDAGGGGDFGGGGGDFGGGGGDFGGGGGGDW